MTPLNSMTMWDRYPSQRLAVSSMGFCLVAGCVAAATDAVRPCSGLSAARDAAAGYAVAGKVATLRDSPDAAVPPCPHFGPCGGCQLQGLQYSAQLAAKQAQVRVASRCSGKSLG